MSRNRKSNTFTFKKTSRRTKSGYLINRNGVPVDRNGNNALQYYNTHIFKGRNF